MTWELFYLACFVVGLIFCLASVFTGGHHAHLHLGAHTHVAAPRIGTANAAHSAAAGHGFSRVNGFTLTAFLCWFGGTGYLLRTHGSFTFVLVLLFATLSGLAGAGIVSWFLSSVLLSHERPLTAEETATTGVLGRVSGPLRPGATGEVLFTQLGTRRSTPARSEDGTSIARGAEVIVLRYEHGIAYVRPWDEFASDPAPGAEQPEDLVNKA